MELLFLIGLLWIYLQCMIFMNFHTLFRRTQTPRSPHLSHLLRTCPSDLWPQELPGAQPMFRTLAWNRCWFLWSNLGAMSLDIFGLKKKLIVSGWNQHLGGSTTFKPMVFFPWSRSLWIFQVLSCAAIDKEKDRNWWHILFQSSMTRKTTLFIYQMTPSPSITILFGRFDSWNHHIKLVFFQFFSYCFPHLTQFLCDGHVSCCCCWPFQPCWRSPRSSPQLKPLTRRSVTPSNSSKGQSRGTCHLRSPGNFGSPWFQLE